MAEVKLKEETELWEPRGPCGSWGPAEEHTHSEAVEPAHLKEEPAHLKEEPAHLKEEPAHLKEEPAHLKEEPELCIKQEPQEFPFHMVTVKTEDDEDKSSVLHQRPTEENREETNGWDCGAEAGCSSDPLTQFHSDSEEEEHTDSSEDTDHSEDYSQEQAPAKRSYAMIPPDATVRDKAPYNCSECGKSFRWKSHLQEHMISHSGEKPHKCPLCQKGFSQKSNLTKHQRTQHHMCTVCEVCFPDFMNLKKHLKTHIKEETADQSILKPHSCPECGKKFRWKSKLWEHKFIHLGKSPYTCPVCEKSFIHKVTLRKHLRTEHHMCTVCEAYFPDDLKLKEHLKTHVEDGTLDPLFLRSYFSRGRPYSCSECGKRFPIVSRLQRHMLAHSEERPHKCSVCEKSFKAKSVLQIHMFVHSGEKPYICSECGKRFPNDTQLQRHMTIHTRGKPHKCSDCKKAFGKESHLTQHQKRVHHICPVCGERFPHKIKLNEHLKTHVEDGTLDQRFLESHNSVHSDVKPKCSICDKCFGNTFYLSRHLRDQHHTCSFCNEGFPNSSKLKEHLRTHLNGETVDQSILQFRVYK